MAKTAHYELEKPDESRNVNDEFLTLKITLDQLDGILWAISQAVEGKAAAGHGHTIGQISGLSDALNAKMAASKTFKFDDLTDVDGATDAAVGYLLVKRADGTWTPSSAAAAIGVHGHAQGDIAGLGTALAAKAPLADPTFTTRAKSPKFELTNGESYIANGNGDAASYTTYNIAFKGWWGMGMLAHDNTVKGFYDFRAGKWDTKGGFFKNGVEAVYNNGGTYGINISGSAYPRRSDGAGIIFNWSGQGGQPTWVWGGNDGVNMYVYNPANFSVSYANSAGSAGSANYAASAGNADTVDGLHASAFWQTAAGAGSAASGWVKFPNGLVMNIGSGVVAANASAEGTMNFPSAFPTGCLTVVACGGDPNVPLTELEVGGLSPTAFNFRANGAPNQSVRVNWIAWGY